MGRAGAKVFADELAGSASKRDGQKAGERDSGTKSQKAGEEGDGTERNEYRCG